MAPRLRAALGKRQRDRTLDEELRTHLSLLVEQNIECGMSPQAARRAAKLSLGGADQIKESVHDHRGLPLLETFVQDLRFAFRMLRKSPGFTAVAVLTLALGIGANTAIFSAVNGIWLEPLLNAHFSRFVTVNLLSIPEIQAIQKQSTAFERTAIYQGSFDVISGGAVAEQVTSSYVSDDFFPSMGTRPLLGRFVLPGDVQLGSSLVAVMSYGLWQDDFGGDPHIVGRTISVNEKPYTVIGVMPKGFTLGTHWMEGDSPGVWMPSSFPLSDPSSTRRISSFVALLKKGATIDEVKTQLDAIYTRLETAYPKQYPKAAELYGCYGWIVTAGIRGAPSPFVRLVLSILFSAVGFVLLMACINVASLLVARSWGRQRELTIRRALGATRFRIVRQLLSESLLLAIAGGSLGLFFSIWGVRLIRLLAPPYTPRIEYIRLNTNVLCFTMAASLLAAILVGLAPALHATSRRVGATLKGGLSGSFAAPAVRKSRWFRSALVVLEVALAVVVVTGGALMAHSFYRLMHLDTGVRADHVITMSVNLSDSVCKDRSQQKKPEEGTKQPQAAVKDKQVSKQKSAKDAVWANYGPSGCYTLANEDLLDTLHSLPGVQQAAFTAAGIIEGGEIRTSIRYPGELGGQGLWIEGNPESELSGQTYDRGVTSGYFAALGIRLLKGRSFQQHDGSRPVSVAIVSEAFARKYIPGDPIGKRFSVDTDENGGHPWMTIVGEVNDVRDRALGPDSSDPTYYTPYVSDDNLRIIVRTSADPATIIPAVLRVVRSLDQDAPVSHIETLDQVLARSADEPRFQTALLSSFGILGLLLAVIGTYGVASYSVVQRTHEIGIRMAMGAEQSDVLGLILCEGLLLALIGIGIGLAGALALTRFLSSLLFEIKPTDPATFISVAVLLVLVSLAACSIPARRAMKVDPMVALRYDR
ncbi:MAG TPA: ABC transporter permease [Candidatus Acidoferrales bacterium]|nr:ABC transporter permease [Candidatus Acidoferrales bacterium]